MKTYSARVENGRLVMDEPTELPDGTEVAFMPRGETDWDDLEEEERAELHEALERALREPEGRPAEEVLRELRQKRD